MTSDHSPVFASFEVGVASQFVSKQGRIFIYISFSVMTSQEECNAVILYSVFRSEQCT